MTTSKFQSDFDEMDFGSIGNYEQYFEVDTEFEELGVNPQTPTEAKPGSDDKVVMLAARYAAGLPLWHNEDRYDHGPGQDAEIDDEF